MNEKSKKTGKNTSVSGRLGDGRKSIYDNDADRKFYKIKRTEQENSKKTGGKKKNKIKKQSSYEHRILIRTLSYVALAVVVIATAITLSMTVLFNITAITVEIGEGVPYTEADVLGCCGIQTGDNLFVTSMKESSQDITTALPYIEVCDVKRSLPSTVVIKTRAAVVMGAAPLEDGQYAVLSTGGKVLELVGAERKGEFMPISGMKFISARPGEYAETENPSQAQVAAMIISEMDSYGLKTASVTFRSNGWVSAGFENRLELVFGTPSNLDEKVKLAAALINEGKITKNEAGDIDLSIDGRATFTPDYLK